MPQRLTDRSVSALKPDPARKDYLVFDNKTSALGVRVSSNGRKTFLVQSRAQGRQFRKPLGLFGNITVEKARNLAKAEIGRVSADPKYDPRAASRKGKAKTGTSTPVTLGGLIDAWVSELQKKERAPSYIAISRSALERAYRPLLPRLALSITKNDLAPLWDAISGRAAAHLLATITRTLFRWAVGKNLLQDDPSKGLAIPEAPASRRRALDEDESRKVWRAAEALPSPYRQYLRFLALTCQRRSEVAGARWSEFNSDRTLWTIPGSRMKTGEPHKVPLSEEARAILTELPRFTWSDRVFSADGRRPVAGFAHIKRRLDAALKKNGDELDGWRLHDWRRSAVSWMAAHGVSITVADLLLAHKPSQLSTVGAIYQQYDHLPERRDALARWGAFLASA
jgi:integrase